jgi:DNA-binding HxlR family transcriptional regulator
MKIDESEAPAVVDNVTGDVFRKACPAREVLEVLASKWTLLIIHALASGPTRTGALRRRIEGISEKMLSQTLKELERRHLVKRNAYPEVPPRVDYELTPLGRSLCEIVKTLDDWVERYGRVLS